MPYPDEYITQFTNKCLDIVYIIEEKYTLILHLSYMMDMLRRMEKIRKFLWNIKIVH